MIIFLFMEDSNNSKTQIHVAMSIWEEFEMQRKIHRIVPVTENNGELQYLFRQFTMYKTTNATCFSH